jgi:predicted N-acetyltransferase YhbS
MDIIIRPAGPADIPAIHRIILGAFRKYADVLGLDGQVSALKETEADIAREIQEKTVLVAVRGTETVGSVRFEMVSEGVAYLTRFGVDPTVHNSGIGKLLLAAVDEYAAKQGAKVIALHTASKMTPLVRMYYGMGYYIKSTSEARGYIRALFLKELTEGALPDLIALANL